MKKRMTDIHKWDDVWFSELTPEHKLLYLYILDKCDNVGVWEPNFKLAQFQLGVEFDWNEIIDLLGKDRIEILNNGSWYFKKFCNFQYGNLDENNLSKVRQSYITLLKSHGLWKGYQKAIHTPKDKEEDKDTEKEKEVYKETEKVEDKDFIHEDKNDSMSFMGDEIRIPRYKGKSS